MTTPTNPINSLTDVDPDEFDVRLDDERLSSAHISAGESGLTPIHRQNIDESRIDELLVDDGVNEDHFPTIRDIADPNAIHESYDN